MSAPGSTPSFFPFSYANMSRSTALSSQNLPTFPFSGASIVASSASEARKPANELKVLAQNIVFGGCAGVFGQALVFPLYTAKTNMQNAPTVYNSGLLHCARDIASKRGLKGLYTGIKPTLTFTFPEKAIKLAMNDFLRKKFADEKGNVNLARGMAAGAGAGLCQVVVTNPMELLMITMQTRQSAEAALSVAKVAVVKNGAAQAAAAPKPPPASGMLGIARELGLRRMYADVPATLLRDIPFSVIFFPLHTYLQEKFADENGDTPVQKVLLSGFLAGSTAATLSTPMDVVKTRVMADTGAVGGNKSAASVSQTRRIIQVFGEIYATQGVKGLFNGVGPRFLIISPLFGITTMAYEALKKLREKDIL